MNNLELNELLDTEFKIYQNKEYFKYSLDSILLAKAIVLDHKDKALLDLCCGNAPLPIYLSKNNNLNIYGMELQREIYNLAKKSIEINNINNVKIINDNIKNAKNYFPGNNFDIITCNPPYFKLEEKSLLNKSSVKSIARHEICITLEEIIKIAQEMLRVKGKFYLIHRTERLQEIMELLSKYKFGIKTLQFVYDNPKKNSSMVIILSKKNCKSDIRVLPAIYNKGEL